MLGVSATNDQHRKTYFAHAARRFALDAKMMRYRAAVHVENKDDVLFWGHVLKHFRPNDKFYFISGSRNEYGHKTSGVTQCLKYAPYLSPDFFICIDSDYRYLLQDEKIDVEHYILQTYTYSFENHHCFAGGLDAVCSRVTHWKNTVFDFSVFLKEFSNILYELFIWHLYLMKIDTSIFSQSEFSTYVGLSNFRMYPLVIDNGRGLLNQLQHRVNWKISFLERSYSDVSIDQIKQEYAQLGITPDNVYLFVRGHNLYDMISLICKEVCKAMLRSERRNHEVTREMIRELYRNRHSLNIQLQQNIQYGAYWPIQKIEGDIYKLLGKS
jgi:hypothetical protein